MDLIKVNFNCPKETVEAIDEEAQADHRDRTSMLNKIIAYYFENHTHQNGYKRVAKKAGRR